MSNVCMLYIPRFKGQIYSMLFNHSLFAVRLCKSETRRGGISLSFRTKQIFNFLEHLILSSRRHTFRCLEGKTMKELTSAKKRESEDEVDNMVGFRGNQKSQEKENLMECEGNQHGDFTDGGETGENDEGLRISNEVDDDGTHRRVLRNMVGTRDENVEVIIDDSDEKNIVVNDRGDELQLYPFSMLDCLGVIASIIVFFFDVVTDILLAIEYKDHGRTVECALTSSVVIASFLVAGTLSTIWYLQDESGNKGTVKNILFLIVAFPFATIIR